MAFCNKRTVYLLLVACFFLSISILNISGCDSSSSDSTTGTTDTGDDTNVTTTYYQDSDSDGYGNGSISLESTSQPNGYVLTNTDCNDNDASINPGATEICEDGTDQDCDGMDTECSGTIYIEGENATYQSIQAAIDASVAGDKVLVTAGTYYENINFNGKTITIKSVSGATNTIINGSANGTVLTFMSGEGLASVVDGFTITNGAVTEGNISGSYSGSAIYCDGTSPTIKNCIMTNNSGNGYRIYGGVIYCKNSSPTITNCTISSNSISGEFDVYGGVIYCLYSSPTITDCLIINNTATATYVYGWMLCYASSPTVTNCTISGNVPSNTEGCGNVGDDGDTGSGEDHGDTWQSATLISINSTVNGEINTTNDVDWFKFNANSGTFYLIDLDKISNPSAYLFFNFYDEDYVMTHSTSSSSNGGSTIMSTGFIAEGAYYIKVEGDKGNDDVSSYTLSVR